MNLSPLDLENGQSGLTVGQHCVQPLHRRQSQHGVDDSFILHAFHAFHASHAFHAFHAWQDSGVAQRQAFLSQCRQMCTVVLFFFATWADLPCYAQGARPIPDALAAALAGEGPSGRALAAPNIAPQDEPVKTRDASASSTELNPKALDQPGPGSSGLLDQPAQTGQNALWVRGCPFGSPLGGSAQSVLRVQSSQLGESSQLSQLSQRDPVVLNRPAESSPANSDKIWNSSDDAAKFERLSVSEKMAEITDLVHQESLCLKNSAYYARLGLYWLLLPSAQDALEPLERSLLLNTEQPSVQLDFALSLALTGDLNSANALLDQVLQRSDMPESLRQALGEVRTQGWGVLSNPMIGLHQTKGLASSWRQGPLISDLGNKAAASGVEGLPALTLSQEAGVPGQRPAPSVDESSRAPWRGSGSVQAMVGADTNLNSASYTSTINLTLPNGIVPLALDASSLPKKGGALVLAGQGLAQTSLGSQLLGVSGTWMERKSPGLPELTISNQEIAVQVKSKEKWGWGQRGGLTHFELGGAAYFDGFNYNLYKEWSAPILERLLNGWSSRESASNPSKTDANASFIGGLQPKVGSPQAGLSGQSANSSAFSGNPTEKQQSNASPIGQGLGTDLPSAWVCQYLTGLEAERRTYALDSTQDGTYRGLKLGAMCEKGSHQMNLTAQTGVDWASDMSRAGGKQQRQELHFQWAHVQGLGRLMLELGVQRLLDEQIYSELLGSVVRNTSRENVGLNYDYDVTKISGIIQGSLHWVSSWESLRYRSTVDLFNMKRLSVQTGLRWDF